MAVVFLALWGGLGENKDRKSTIKYAVRGRGVGFVLVRKLPAIVFTLVISEYNDASAMPGPQYLYSMRTVDSPLRVCFAYPSPKDFFNFAVLW